MDSDILIFPSVLTQCVCGSLLLIIMHKCFSDGCERVLERQSRLQSNQVHLELIIFLSLSYSE